jgi:oxygen-independent coproporphyrinogen-3 oxidase
MVTEPLPPVALYLHLPFCIARCPYCDFVVYAGADARGPRALTDRLYEALARELEVRASLLDAAFGRPGSNGRPLLESVYFGGGTPSLVPSPVLGRLLETAARRFGLAADPEITIEVNPGPEDRGDIVAFRALGVNRLSIGAQSLNAGDLRRLGRRHSPVDVAATIAQARAAGIGSINLDLLYDVPGQSLADWEATLLAALELEPEHLSLYALTLDDPDAEGLTGEGGDHLPTPPGARRWRDRARAEQDDDRAAQQYRLAFELLAARGWHGYEISNWSRPGHESRHNLAYWLRRPYEAVGPGAHAFDGRSRRWNGAAMGPYLAALLGDGAAADRLGGEIGAADMRVGSAAEAPFGASGPSESSSSPRPLRLALPPGGEEVLTRQSEAAEAAILSLRLDTGLSVSEAREEPLAATMAWGLEAGLIERAMFDGEPRLHLTLRGRLLSNEVFSRLV